MSGAIIDARRIYMKSIGLAIAGLFIPVKQGCSYPPNGSFPEEMFLFPEIAVFLMLGLRIFLLIVGRFRICRPLTLSSGACTWGHGLRSACNCA